MLILNDCPLDVANAGTYPALIARACSSENAHSSSTSTRSGVSECSPSSFGANGFSTAPPVSHRSSSCMFPIFRRTSSRSTDPSRSSVTSSHRDRALSRVCAVIHMDARFTSRARCAVSGEISDVFPARRSSSAVPSSYAHSPGSGSPAASDWTSRNPSTICCWCGMNGRPMAADTAPTAGPYDGRSGVRGVAHLGGTVHELQESPSFVRA